MSPRCSPHTFSKRGNCVIKYTSIFTFTREHEAHTTSHGMMSSPPPDAGSSCSSPPSSLMTRHRRPYLQPPDPQRAARNEKLIAYFNHRAWEDGTHANRQTSVRSYEDCCTSNDIPAEPVTYKSLAFFAVTFRLRGNKHSSLIGYISHLKVHFESTGRPWLSPSDEYQFKLVMRGLAKFNPTPVQRKRPITKAILLQMLLHADLSITKDLQTMTMAWLAHDALLRGAELLKLRVKDIRWHRSSDTSADAHPCTVMVESAKCNKDGPAEPVHIKPYGSISAPHLLQQYFTRLQLSNVKDQAPLFPLIIRNSSSSYTVTWGAKHDKQSHFVPELRRILSAAGFTTTTEFSGHSFRAGGATDLFNGGCSPEFIKRHGRWKSDCFYIYIRTDPVQVATAVASHFAAA